MDYTTLIAGTASDGSIKNWVMHDSIPSSVIVQEAEQWIYRRLRVRDMVTVTSGTATTSQASIPTNNRYLETRHLMWTGTDRLVMRQSYMEDVLNSFAYNNDGSQTTGQPARYFDEGTALTFDRLPDKAYTYRWTYYQQPAVLGTATTTNFLTDRHPYLMRCVCMMFATDVLKQNDDRTLWEQRAYNEIGQANREDDKRLRDLDLFVMPG